MGEKVEVKNEGEKAAAADGGEKKAEAPAPVVLKLDLHCEGCAKKVRRSISNLQGVEKVKADYDAKELTVTGNVDPTWLREKVESKTKKKVELLSPPPKKDGGAAAATAEEKPETKTEEKKGDDSKKPKEAVVSTVLMKIKLHCDGCANKIKRVILKNIDGVKSVSTNLQKDAVSVTGTMDSNELVTFLKEKLKRSVEIVAPKKDDAGDDKKEKESGGGADAGGEKKDKQGSESGGAEKKEGGGEKKEGKSKAAVPTSQDGGANGGETSKGGSGEGTKVEVNKLEHHIYNPNTYYTTPMYNQAYVHQDYGAPMYHHDPYSNTGYAMQYAQGPPPPPPTYVNPNDNMFSDENPNGCSIM